MLNILKNRKTRFFLAFFSLFILFDMIQDSYGKYVSSASATGNFAIARWAFTVNDQDVLSNNDFTTTILPIFDSNSYVADGYIAPNSTGHFDIEIDSTDVDVTFLETITLSLSNDNTVSDLTITGYILNDGNFVPFTNGNSVITNNHELNELNTVNTYHIFVEWKEGTGEIMNNAADTAASANGIAEVQVNINFIQTTTNNNNGGDEPSSGDEPEPGNGGN